MTESFDKARLIRAVILIEGGALESLLQNVGTEDLRRLCKDQMFPRQCRFYKFSLCLLNGIHDRNSQNRGAATLRLPYNVLDFTDSDKRSHAIVNRDNIGSRLKVLEAHSHGILPALSTLDDRNRFCESRRFDETPYFVHGFAWRGHDDVIDDTTGVEFST